MKQVQATPKFYHLFSGQEINNLVQHIQNYQTIPFKWFYRGKIIENWQQIIQKQKQAAFSTLKSDARFLKEGLLWIDKQQELTEPLTIVDIGVGNAEPVKTLVDILTKAGLLTQYIAIDISREMLSLAETNLKNWFPDLTFLGYQGDLETQSVLEIINPEKLAPQGQNLWIYIGGTIGNNENRIQVLKNLQKSLGEGEYLLLTCSLRFTDSQDQYTLKDHISVDVAYYIAELLDILPEDIEIEGKFDQATNTFLTNLIFKEDYQVKIESAGTLKTVHFPKGERFNIYRYYCYEIDNNNKMQSLIEDCQTAGLNVNSYNLDVLLSRVMLICHKNTNINI
ncbi:L-histidine N(alpha)-methyltransferase [Spirulina sp. CS-785/01]|uniref:L-histidine N(alpha)-methyltransferase n=1 Tax=Spirulina sp. CS-785/01 TaxID=3021716 RepID=UPI00232C597B|nr:L-histidine N(alpha)-methyltransferase [Spirulina sp. CS-785/01]MDB9314625.1 L-histidine N(alpha)-methyltransferase [Spirulina sp. CS-785/01]